MCKTNCGRYLCDHRLAALADDVISQRTDDAIQELDGQTIDKESIAGVLAKVEAACQHIGKDAHALVKAPLEGQV